jgi:hypothetical protein
MFLSSLRWLLAWYSYVAGSSCRSRRPRASFLRSRLKTRLAFEQLEARVALSSLVSPNETAYAPGETALFALRGFQKGETVDVQVLHTDGTPFTGSGLISVRDGGAGDLDGVVNGNLLVSYVLPLHAAGSWSQVTARGESSGLSAEATFKWITPWVLTDKPDYAVGETVNITGGGWQPGETVQLQVLHTDGITNNAPEHIPWDVVADTSGRIASTWTVQADERGSRLQLECERLICW